jgi:hypothetical protein
MNNARPILAQCAKALKPSGVIIVSDVCLKRRAETETCDRGLLTPEELTKSLTLPGFEVVVSEDHTPALRTYAAELLAEAAFSADGGPVKNQVFNLSCLFSASCDLNGLRLSDLGYILIIARKTGD